MAEAGNLQALIAAVRNRWFMTVALRTAGTAMAAAAVPVLAAFAVYRLFAAAGGTLLLLTASASVLAVAAAWLVARRIEPRPDDTRVARFIEERAEHLPIPRPMDDAVVSAVRVVTLSPADARAAFATLVLGAALRRLEGIDAPAIVPGAELRRAAAIGTGGALLLAVALVLGAPALVHAYEAARLLLFSRSVVVEVLPGDTRVAAGRPLTITARLTAGGGTLVRARPTLVVSAGPDERSVEMTPTSDGFAFAFESVDRSFRYKVTAGAASSSEYTVTALFAPRVKRIDLQYQYPSFTGLASRIDEDSGDIYAPEGTRVRLRIHTDKPVVSGQLGMAKGGGALRNAGDQLLEADLVVARDDSYRIRLLDRDGLASSDDSEYFIRVMEDRPPDVRILRPSSDQGITPLQEVAIEARAEDDYGIASLDLVYSIAGGAEHVVPFSRLTGGDTQRTGAHLLAAEELQVRAGDVITYYAKARDVARGRRSTETRSDIFFLEVKPFNEEFVAAQSQAGAGANGDPQIDSLIQAQKDIISATWNIERRAAGGRSADDIKAVARAQAELQARAERVLAGPRGRRGRGYFPERQLAQPAAQTPSAPQGDPIAAAVEAMARAAERLGSERTREAIPHELSALNGLLQAQAEVRRRQISQQARGTGSGGNRQSQDLSALFDKELQRQQCTNYEQRSQVEERQNEQQTDQDMLDRVRDLARRQEELNRKQRELGQQTQAEERRRQLEQLAREQEELQRQTEALAKEMDQRSGRRDAAQQGQRGEQEQQAQGRGQPSQGQGQGQPSQGQGQSSASQQSQQGPGNTGMRGAAEQMNRAAGDMRRSDEQSAARNGERAASQLRDLEKQMRGGADARQRAAADLQAEAQQIAQEQRRIASEAERMEKSGEAGSTDARRRLAADKDRLSDRVDSMQREAQRQAGSQPQGRSGDSARPGPADARTADEQARARDAAAELGRQKVGERMRQSAQQLRDGVKPAEAAVEQQLAGTLDKVVEKLGGASSADARKLAEQLDRSKEMRERLDRLEGQLKQAEGRKDGSAEKVRQAYEQELGRARDTLGQQGGGPRSGDQRGGGPLDGTGRSTPEGQEFSRSAPGTEAFKQDRSGWQSLRKDVDRALEEHDAAVSRRLAKSLGDEGLHAGGSDRVPEHYRRLVAKYYESLTKVKK